jgi:cobalt/nickel transport system permease protein
MHIPDRFLSAPVAGSAALLSAGAVALACWRARRALPAHHVPMLGLSAAFIFAAQMINFPVAGGTSGHLIGGTLAAVLLGPSAAIVAMVAVLIVQCLLFADGGVTALGANALNMAVLAPLAGYGAWRLLVLLLPGSGGRLAAAGGAAWLSTVLAAAMCGGQIALSGQAPAGLVLPAMVGVHALIGLGEAIITVMVLAAVWRARPAMLARSEAAGLGTLVGYSAVVSVAVAVFVSPFACPWPDGLEHVAEKLGLRMGDAPPLLGSWFSGYQAFGIENEGWSTAVAGAIGVGLLLAAAAAMNWWLARSARPTARVPESAKV